MDWSGTLNKKNQKMFYIYLKTEISKNTLYFYIETGISKKFAGTFCKNITIFLYSLKTEILMCSIKK